MYTVFVQSCTNLLQVCGTADTDHQSYSLSQTSHWRCQEPKINTQKKPYLQSLSVKIQCQYNYQGFFSEMDPLYVHVPVHKALALRQDQTIVCDL